MGSNPTPAADFGFTRRLRRHHGRREIYRLLCLECLSPNERLTYDPAAGRLPPSGDKPTGRRVDNGHSRWAGAPQPPSVMAKGGPSGRPYFFWFTSTRRGNAQPMGEDPGEGRTQFSDDPASSV